MTLNKFTSATTAVAAEVNENFNNSLTLTGLNTIRQLLDRSGVFSVGKFDGWGEAYISLVGREGSVSQHTSNTGSTTTRFYNTDNIYVPGFTDLASGDTTHDPDSVSNPSNFFDSDDSTEAVKGKNDTAGSYTLGKTFTAQTIGLVKVKANMTTTSGAGNINTRIILQSYNGSTWDDEATLNTGTGGTRSYNDVYNLSKSVQGVRVKLEWFNDTGNWSATAHWSTLEYGGSPLETNIIHTLPVGTFNTTISSAIGVPLIKNWDASDSDIQFKLQRTIGNNFIIIEATSISSISDFAINNCKIEIFSAGKWLLYSVTGTDAVRRAQIYKTLFYGTDGTNPRASSTYITSITALKTSNANDVGKRAHLVYELPGANSTTYRDAAGVFVNTASNTNCSSWSNFRSESNTTSFWELPTSTRLNSAVAVGVTSLEIGTDRSADETDNPADCVIRGYGIISGTTNHQALILCVGDITWTDTGTSGSTTFTDFFTDNSIPLFTATTENPPDEDSGWLDTMNSFPAISNFTVFTGEPTVLIIKLTPKSSSPTDLTPGLYGFWVRAE